MITISNVNVSAGTVRKLPDGKWQATLTIGEGRGAQRKRKNFDTAKAARAWLAEAKATGVPCGPTATQTVAQAFDAYVAAKILRRNTVEVFAAARKAVVAQGIGAVKLAALKPSALDIFTKWALARYAPSTANLYARKLAAVLKFAHGDGGLGFVPKARTVSVPDVKIDALTPAQVKALYEASPEDFAPAILLGAFAGLRASEAAAITVADIDFVKCTVTVSKAADDLGAHVATKTTRSLRSVPFAPEALPLLGQACVGKPYDAAVATSSTGRALTTTTLSKTFGKVAEHAGLAVTFHQLRKFYGTTLAAAGVNPASGAKYLGDTIEVYLRTYALPQAGDADEARAALAKAFAATVAA
jgi:integrase